MLVRKLSDDVNEHFFLKHGSDSIAVIGVENWGEQPFPTYGDLGKAYPDVNDGTFKLLLSHNPKHWDEVVSKTSNIDLTLSGHTHAMQMMLSLGSVKLSPSVFRYKHWQGLTERGQAIFQRINVSPSMPYIKPALSHNLALSRSSSSMTYDERFLSALQSIHTR